MDSSIMTFPCSDRFGLSRIITLSVIICNLGSNLYFLIISGSLVAFAVVKGG